MPFPPADRDEANIDQDRLEQTPGVELQRPVEDGFDEAQNARQNQQELQQTEGNRLEIDVRIELEDRVDVPEERNLPEQFIGTAGVTQLDQADSGQEELVRQAREIPDENRDEQNRDECERDKRRDEVQRGRS